MSETNEHIDKLFREKLGNYSKEPPGDIWEFIREGIGRKPQRKAILLAWRVAAGVAILITAGYLYYSVRQGEKGEITENRSMQEVMVMKTDSIYKSDKTARIVSQEDTTADYRLAKDETKSSERIVLAEAGKELHRMNLQDAGLPESPVAIIEISDIHLKADIYPADIPFLLHPYMAEPDKILEKKLSRTDRYIKDITEESVEDLVEKKDIWSLTAQISPVYSYRTLGSHDEAAVASMNESESGKLSYGGGLQLGYKATERLSFYGGLMYSTIGLQVSNLVSYDLDKYIINGGGVIEKPRSKINIYDLNNSTGFIRPDKSDEFVINPKSEEISYSSSNEVRTDAMIFSTDNNDKIDQYFQFLEIPFMLRYKVLKGKFNLNLLGGVSTSILIGNSVYLLSDDGRSEIGETGGIRTMNYTGNVGFGFDYDLGHNFLFIFEPQLRYYINSINEKNLISNRPYSLGMFTGIRYIF